MGLLTMRIGIALYKVSPSIDINTNLNLFFCIFNVIRGPIKPKRGP